MASAGKKGKKNKGTVISLQSFLSNGETPIGTTQVAKKIRNVDGEDSDDGSNSLPLVYQLPTAPRANRIFEDESIPHKPPFIAYVTNLPFDANEDDIYSFFGTITLASLRLPREDGETGRVRGFGYAEFKSRDDLIHVLSLPDPSIKGRRIRIELCNENEQMGNKQRTNRRGFDGFGNSSENRDSTNWRRDTQSQESGNFSSNYDRSFTRDRRTTGDDGDDAPGSWRVGNRQIAKDISPRRDRDNERQRDISIRNKNFERDDRERSHRNDEDIGHERPKLNLKPRTLPLPEINIKSDIVETEIFESTETTKKTKSSGIAPEKVFGSAKPVDTATRELEIEERLAEARRHEKQRRDQENVDNEVNNKLSEIHLEKTDKENANSVISWRRTNNPAFNIKPDEKRHSPDRIGLSQTDDRRRENRGRDLNRYSKSSEKNDRSEQRVKSVQTREGKPRDDSKSRRDTKIDRPLPKFQQNQAGPILQSSNKYSGLDDDASE